MARAPNENIKKAKELYHKGIPMAEIAKQLGVSDSTVRSWKSRYKWDGGEGATLQGKKRNVAKEKTPGRRGKKDVIARDVEEVARNTELTDKQQLFCIYYIRCFNATKAYQKAYGCDYATAMANGSRLMGKAKVKDEILRLKKDRLNRELFSEEDIFQKYMDIAYADITDYVEFGSRDINLGGTDSGEEKSITVSYVNIRNSNEVDGTLVSEVSKGKDGIKVKLADRMKAMQWLSDHMSLATEEQKARIAQMEAQTEQIRNASDNKGQMEVDDWIAGVMGKDVIEAEK